MATAPDELRAHLRDLSSRKRVDAAVRFRPDRQSDPMLATVKLALESLAKRFVALDTEIKQIDRRLEQLVEQTAPALVARRGIGSTVAAIGRPTRRCR